MSGINSGAEIKKITATRAACKILSRERHGRVHLSCQQVIQMFDFFLIFLLTMLLEF